MAQVSITNYMAKLVALTFFVMFYYFMYIGINQVTGSSEIAVITALYLALNTKVGA